MDRKVIAKRLVDIADELDSLGLVEEANEVDSIVVAMMNGGMRREAQAADPRLTAPAPYGGRKGPGSFAEMGRQMEDLRNNPPTEGGMPAPSYMPKGVRDVGRSIGDFGRGIGRSIRDIGEGMQYGRGGMANAQAELNAVRRRIFEIDDELNSGALSPQMRQRKMMEKSQLMGEGQRIRSYYDWAEGTGEDYGRQS